jgi:hypothetical protein
MGYNKQKIQNTNARRRTTRELKSLCAGNSATKMVLAHYRVVAQRWRWCAGLPDLGAETHGVEAHRGRGDRAPSGLGESSWSRASGTPEGPVVETPSAAPGLRPVRARGRVTRVRRSIAGMILLLKAPTNLWPTSWSHSAQCFPPVFGQPPARVRSTRRRR